MVSGGPAMGNRLYATCPYPGNASAGAVGPTLPWHMKRKKYASLLCDGPHVVAYAASRIRNIDNVANIWLALLLQN